VINLGTRIITLNIFSLLVLLLSVLPFRRDRKLVLYFSPMFFLVYRSLLLPLFFTLDLFVLISLSLGLLLVLAYILYVDNIRSRLFNDLTMTFLLLVFYSLYMVGRISSVAFVSYCYSIFFLWLLWRDMPSGVYLFALLFALSWLCDVRELVIVFWKDLDKHFPGSFFITCKYMLWLSLIPVLYYIGVLETRPRRLIIALIPTIVANVLQIFDYGLDPIHAKLLAIGIRLLPLVSVVMLVRGDDTKF